MDISSQITVSIKPEQYQSLLNMNAFKPGDTLRLRVLELKGDRALIDFGYFRATADIKIPVTLGQEFPVRVLESGRQLKLGVINLEPKNPASIDLLVHRPETPADDSLRKIQADLSQTINLIFQAHTDKAIQQTILNVLGSLSAYFEPFDLTKNITELISRLKSYLENSGLFFEKTLEKAISGFIEDTETVSPKKMAHLPEVQTMMARDLKANLLMLQHLVEDKETRQKFLGPKALTSLNSSINTLLADITQQQGRAVGQFDSPEPFQVFSYALPLKEETQTAKLKVYYLKKQKPGFKKGFRISLLLSMDRLGDIRTDFFLIENNLTITFFVKEHSTKIKIQENYPALQELLTNFFEQFQLKVMVSEKKVADFHQENIQVAGDRQVDLRI